MATFYEEHVLTNENTIEDFKQLLDLHVSRGGKLKDLGLSFDGDREEGVAENYEEASELIVLIRKAKDEEHCASAR